MDKHPYLTLFGAAVAVFLIIRFRGEIFEFLIEVLGGLIVLIGIIFLWIFQGLWEVILWVILGRERIQILKRIEAKQDEVLFQVAFPKNIWDTPPGDEEIKSSRQYAELRGLCHQARELWIPKWLIRTYCHLYKEAV